MYEPENGSYKKSVTFMTCGLSNNKLPISPEVHQDLAQVELYIRINNIDELEGEL
jgi:hypothetical protein